MKRLFCLILSAILLLGLCSGAVLAAEREDIVILYENDVHCAVEGYATLAAMKQELSQIHDHVGVVSVGDFVQGSSLGAVSQGSYIVELMNMVGYDAIALGNHEFDYRIDRLMELVSRMETKPVCCNFRQVGSGTSVFEPFTMVSYGDTDIAYIGVTTPSTISSSSPAQFMAEDGRTYRYTFSGDTLYATVQASIDAAQQAGAEYIIALSHLGTESVNESWSAQALVENTDGLDVVLDGHSHSVLEEMTLRDAGGGTVVISSTGTKFAHIGKLTISEGEIETELVKTELLTKADPAVTERIAAMEAEYAALGGRKIGRSEVDLVTHDENGQRIIRNTETNLGDFCADAFRIVTGADVGLMNGGGIRESMAAGEVTFNHILSVQPFNNTVVTAKVSGQDLLDFLELCVMTWPEENGSFQHVSGLTFDMDPSIPSSVVLDENEVFVRVDGPYRVKNVEILDEKTGTYLPLDVKKSYVVASHNYLLLEQGSGASMFRDAEILLNDGMLDVELIEKYIVEHLGGVIGQEYADAQGRIRILDGSASQVHTVKPGDNLWNISRKYGCAYADLLRQNGWIKNPDVILVGWELQIP